LIIAETTHVGLQRAENQDSLGRKSIDNYHLFVVCDGVGGLPNGKLASETAVQSLLDAFKPKNSGVPESLQLAMESSQSSVMSARSKPLGTTVVALCIFAGRAYAGWCGDSRIYHFRNGALQWMSRDHNVLHDILNKGGSSGGRYVNPQALNRFYGREFRVDSEFHSISLEKDDMVLLCSDGLSNFLMEPDIIHAVTNNSPQEASDLMERKLLTDEIGAPDNFTWYIIQI
jgi:serine/threonine protein phosphatase PrpC